MNYRLCCTLVLVLAAHLQFNFRLFRLFGGDMLLLFGTGTFQLLLHCINTNHLFRAQQLLITAGRLLHLLLGRPEGRLGEAFITTVVERAISIFMNNLFRLFAGAAAATTAARRGTDNTFLQLFEMHLGRHQESDMATIGRYTGTDSFKTLRAGLFIRTRGWAVTQCCNRTG